jgi:hypothetical protein
MTESSSSQHQKRTRTPSVVSANAAVGGYAVPSLSSSSASKHSAPVTATMAVGGVTTCKWPGVSQANRTPSADSGLGWTDHADLVAQAMAHSTLAYVTMPLVPAPPTPIGIDRNQVMWLLSTLDFVLRTIDETPLKNNGTRLLCGSTYALFQSAATSSASSHPCGLSVGSCCPMLVLAHNTMI